MAIRQNRIQKSEPVAPFDINGGKGETIQKLEKMTADATNKLDASKTMRDLKNGAATVLKAKKMMGDVEKALDKGEIEKVLSAVFGAVGSDEAKAISKAVQKASSNLINQLLSEAKAASCVFEGLDTRTTILSLFGYFSIDDINFCNPLKTLEKAMKVTDGLLNKHPSNKSKAIIKDMGLGGVHVVAPVKQVTRIDPNTNTKVTTLTTSGTTEVTFSAPPQIHPVDLVDDVFDPSDYTTAELNAIHASQGLTGGGVINTTSSGNTVGNFLSGDVYQVSHADSATSGGYVQEQYVGALDKIKPTKVPLKTLAGIKPVIPPALVPVINKAVGAGLTENIKKGPTKFTKAVVVLANPKWVKQYMPELPHAIIKAVNDPTSDSQLIDSVFVDYLDDIDDGWYKRTTEKVNGPYVGLDVATDKVRLLPKLNCLSDTRLTGFQKLKLLSSNRKVRYA